MRRIEVFTGEGRRRKWALADKIALVAEMVATDNISELARRHGLRPSKLSGSPRRGGAVDPPGQAVVRDYSSWLSLVSEDGSGCATQCICLRRRHLHLSLVLSYPLHASASCLRERFRMR